MPSSAVGDYWQIWPPLLMEPLPKVLFVALWTLSHLSSCAIGWDIYQLWVLKALCPALIMKTSLGLQLPFVTLTAMVLQLLKPASLKCCQLQILNAPTAKMLLLNAVSIANYVTRKDVCVIVNSKCNCQLHELHMHACWQSTCTYYHCDFPPIPAVLSVGGIAGLVSGLVGSIGVCAGAPILIVVLCCCRKRCWRGDFCWHLFLHTTQSLLLYSTHMHIFNNAQTHNLGIKLLSPKMTMLMHEMV